MSEARCVYRVHVEPGGCTGGGAAWAHLAAPRSGRSRQLQVRLRHLQHSNQKFTRVKTEAFLRCCVHRGVEHVGMGVNNKTTRAIFEKWAVRWAQARVVGEVGGRYLLWSAPSGVLQIGYLQQRPAASNSQARLGQPLLTPSFSSCSWRLLSGHETAGRQLREFE